MYYVTASLENVGGDKMQTSALALTKEAEADITVYFYKPGESGEEQ